MPVRIEDVLALLLELFPGDQQIPMKRIRLNPKNPGPPPTKEQIQVLSANIALRGLLNAIKVMVDKADPLAPGVALHPDNPRIKVDGTPWRVEDFNWMLLAGEGRYKACDLLKWETIRGNILNPTPGEAVEITHLDNDTRDKGWWAAYQSIEYRIAADPNLTQEQVAARLDVSLELVNWAIRR
jgi:ParB-like chromosome segregation protein Spo0J